MMCASKVSNMYAFRESDGELGRILFNSASDMVRCRDLRDAMDKEMVSWRDLLIYHIPAIREVMPPDDRSVMVEGAASGAEAKYRLTIQRTGGQERISKTRLLELGVSPDVIESATEKTKQGETIVVVRVA